MGFNGNKKIKGRKRHIWIDTLGLIVAVVVTAAHSDDRQGLVALWQQYCASRVQRLRKLWVDGGYKAPWLRDWGRGLQQTHTIDLEVSSARANDSRSWRNGGKWSGHWRRMTVGIAGMMNG